MKFLLVVALAVACSARPDIGLDYNNYGYNYNYPSRTYIPSKPSSSFEVPEYQVRTSRINTYETPTYRKVYNYDNYNTYDNYKNYDNYNNYDSVYRNRVVYKTQYDNSGNVQYVGSQGSNNQATVRYETIQPNGPVEVSKHAYFFDAPDDEEVTHTRVRIAPDTSKKDVNLVFVRTPNVAHHTEVITPSQQHQEKTHVYVLVKKPEEGQDVTVPNVAPAKPSKPEVFYVKYKTQKEAEDKIQATLSGARDAAFHASDLGSEGAFVSSIARGANLRNHVGVTVQQVAGANSHTDETVVRAPHYHDSSSSSRVVTSRVVAAPVSSRVVTTEVVRDEVPAVVSRSRSYHPGYTYKK